MEIIYDNHFINNNELLFIIYIITIILMILITIFIGIKENKR